MRCQVVISDAIVSLFLGISSHMHGSNVIGKFCYTIFFILPGYFCYNLCQLFSLLKLIMHRKVFNIIQKFKKYCSNFIFMIFILSPPPPQR